MGSTSTHLQGPPIADFDRDLLAKIFLCNVESDDLYRVQLSRCSQGGLAPLVVARRTSQVCRRWRRIVVECTELWGSILDVQYLNQRKNTWRDIVFRRTRLSLLSIKGTILDTNDFREGLKRFFISILKTHWTRVRCLNMTLGLGNGFFLNSDTVSVLQRPAPYLETLRIQFVNDRLPPSFLLPQFYFTNDSPHLRHLCVPGLCFRTLAPWLRHLRSLALTATFSVSMVLDVLTFMPNLELLDIKNLKKLPSLMLLDAPPGRPLASPDLPRLQYIFIRDTLQTGIKLLSHIRPALDYSLVIFASDINDFTSDANDRTLAQTVLSQYSQHYLDVNSSTRYYVNVGREDCRFSEATGFDYTPPDEMGFVVHLMQDRLSEDSLLLFLNSYSGCDLSKITTLYLNTSLSAAKITETTRAAIVPFFHAFCGVQELGVSGRRALQYLIAISETAEPLFPSLKKLGIDKIDQYCLGTLVHFLAWRRDIGIRIRTLNLVVSLTGELRDFALIDWMHGLEVIFTIVDEFGCQWDATYVCGSGDPRKLHLDHYTAQIRRAREAGPTN